MSTVLDVPTGAALGLAARVGELELPSAPRRLGGRAGPVDHVHELASCGTRGLGQVGQPVDQNA